MASTLRLLALLRYKQHLWIWLLLFLETTPAAVSYCVPDCSCRTEEEGLYVDCSERNFTGLPDIPDELLGKIVYLDLSRNLLPVLPEKPPRLTALRHLLLSGNSLQALPRRWLANPLQLRVLDVSANPHLPLQAIGNGALPYAKYLQKLNASHAQVEDELKSVFSTLYSNSLEILDLSWRRLTEARSWFLVGFPKLVFLDLSGNPLSGGVRLNSTSLEELRLVRTGLDSLPPSTLLDLPNLHALDVSGNRGFSFLMSGGVLSESLTELRARHCELRLESLKAFPNLRYANLQHNGVQSIMNVSFDSAKLVELDLSNNNIYRIHSGAFTRLPALTSLNLANNKIVDIHSEIFATNTQLSFVNVSRNLLVTLGDLKADSLEVLDVSQCSLAEISTHSLIKLPALRWLDLSSNRLESLPDNITSSSLWSLNVSNCRLTSVGNDTFRQLPALQSLGLSGNRFTEPPSRDFFSGNPRLRSLRLHDNPWRCDCASNTFRDFVEYVIQFDQDEVARRARCVSPAAAEGSTLLQACFEVWYPPPDERGSVHRFGATILSVVAVGGGALLLISAVRSSLRRRRKDRKRRRQEELERRIQDREQALRQQIRSEMENDDDDSVFRGPHSRPRRTPSTVTQPPTYEEAVLLSRSQEDLLNGSLPSGPLSAESTGTAAGASVTASIAIAPVSVTCARHLSYDVEVEPVPKTRPVKPPRKTGKAANGDRLSVVLLHSNGNPSSSLSNLQIETHPHSRSTGDITTAIVNNERSENVQRNSEHAEGEIAGSLISRRDRLPHLVDEIRTTNAATSTSAAVTTTPPASVSVHSHPPPPPPPYESAGGSGNSSTLSTPAPRRQRPLSTYSSDASGEDSDESRTPRQTTNCAS